MRDEILYECLHALVGNFFVEVREVAGQDGVEEQAADGCLEDLAAELRVLFAVARQYLDLRAQIYSAEVVRGNSCVGRRKCIALALKTVNRFRHPVATEYDVEKLRGHHDIARARLQDVFVGRHDLRSLHLRGFREGHVDGHRIAVEVGVVCGAYKRMHLYSVALDENRAERLNRLAMKCRRAVEEHVLALDSLFENRPDFRRLVFDEAAGAADVVCEFAREKALDHEWAEEFEYHVLRQSAFVELKIGADDNDGAARVVDTLTEKVLTEIAMLAFQIVGEALERATTTAEDTGNARAAAHGIIQKCVHRFLQNTLFVAKNDFRCVDLLQSLEAVVAVDDATVEVVEIARCVAAAFERNHGAK